MILYLPLPSSLSVGDYGARLIAIRRRITTCIHRRVFGYAAGRRRAFAFTFSRLSYGVCGVPGIRDESSVQPTSPRLSAGAHPHPGDIVLIVGYGSVYRKTQDAPVDRMDELINQEKDIWLQLKTALDAVKWQMPRVRSDSVKANVGKVLSLFAYLGRIRENLHEEMRDRTTRTPSEAKSSDANNRVADLEVKVLNVVGRVQERLTSQEKTLAKLSAPLPSSSTPWGHVDGGGETTKAWATQGDRGKRPTG